MDDTQKINPENVVPEATPVTGEEVKKPEEMVPEATPETEAPTE